MKTRLIICLTIAVVCSFPFAARADRDGFNDAVKAIEKFYRVKHKNIPFLARTGMKAMRTAAKIRGGEWKRLAEAGSVRVVYFEDQNFDSRGEIASFKASVRSSLGEEWSTLVQTLSPKDEEQTHIFIRDAGKNFHVLVITLDRHEGTVVQATVRPEVMAQLLKDPGEMGKQITDEASTSDP